MTPKKKAQEFWIYSNTSLTAPRGLGATREKTDLYNWAYDKAIHVIEMSAFTALEANLSLLKDRYSELEGLCEATSENEETLEAPCA